MQPPIPGRDHPGGHRRRGPPDARRTRAGGRRYGRGVELARRCEHVGLTSYMLSGLSIATTFLGDRPGPPASPRRRPSSPGSPLHRPPPRWRPTPWARPSRRTNPTVPSTPSRPPWLPLPGPGLLLRSDRAHRRRGPAGRHGDPRGVRPLPGGPGHLERGQRGWHGADDPAQPRDPARPHRRGHGRVDLHTALERLASRRSYGPEAEGLRTALAGSGNG
jgi:hypothetical protein